MSLLPKQLKKAITLRAAGHSLSAITDRLGVSTSTLYRAFKLHSVERGALSTISIQEAKNALLEDAGFQGELKLLIAASIASDLQISKQIMTCISLSVDELLNDATTPASVKARALSALSVSLKSTSDTVRRALSIDSDTSLTTQEIPGLSITRMTVEEIDAAQSLNDDKDG